MVVFDLGNVVFRTDDMATFREWSAITGIPDVNLVDHLREHARWREFEKGEMTTLEFFRHINQLLDFDLTMEQFTRGWNSIYREVYSEVERSLESMVPGVMKVALSNTNSLHSEAWKPMYAATMTLFDSVYLSHEMGMRKPDPRCFEVVLKNCQASASRALFFDDRAEHIESARALGMTAVKVDEPEDVTSSLAAYGLTRSSTTLGESADSRS